MSECTWPACGCADAYCQAWPPIDVPADVEVMAEKLETNYGDSLSVVTLCEAAAMLRQLSAYNAELEARHEADVAVMSKQAAEIAKWKETSKLWTRELDAENAALRKDAERYRWLRSEDAATDPTHYPFWQEFNAKLCREQKMDAAIDAAIAKEQT